jgi:hypothetical protein
MGNNKIGVVQMNVCCCSSPACQKYGCRNWNAIQGCGQSIPIFVGYSHPVQTGAKPHKCPVCDGRGGFFISGTMDEKCNACINGIVWG